MPLVRHGDDSVLPRSLYAMQVANGLEDAMVTDRPSDMFHRTRHEAFNTDILLGIDLDLYRLTGPGKLP